MVKMQRSTVRVRGRGPASESAECLWTLICYAGSASEASTDSLPLGNELESHFIGLTASCRGVAELSSSLFEIGADAGRACDPARESPAPWARGYVVRGFELARRSGVTRGVGLDSRAGGGESDVSGV